jgi:hypothetical protein
MPRINPRPIFRDAIKQLENARCPECSRTYDAEEASEEYCPRIVPLNCSWCSQRLSIIRDFRLWQRQDATAAKKG